MAPKMYRLTMRIGPNPGQAFDLTKAEVNIGRDTSNDIVITDSEVSRRHARLVLQPGGYVLEDLGSTNGTYANGQRLLGPHVLRPGELVMLGENVGLLFEITSDEQTPIEQTPPPAFVASPPVTRLTPQKTPTPQAAAVNVPSQAKPMQKEIYPSPEKKSNQTFIWVGCALLLIMACLLIVGVYLFDYFNLYCVAPFNNLFYCP